MAVQTYNEKIMHEYVWEGRLNWSVHKSLYKLGCGQVKAFYLWTNKTNFESYANVHSEILVNSTIIFKFCK